jgi:hypothetical protein
LNIPRRYYYDFRNEHFLLNPVEGLLRRTGFGRRGGAF